MVKHKKRKQRSQKLLKRDRCLSDTIPEKKKELAKKAKYRNASKQEIHRAAFGEAMRFCSNPTNKKK